MSVVSFQPVVWQPVYILSNNIFGHQVNLFMFLFKVLSLIVGQFTSFKTKNTLYLYMLPSFQLYTSVTHSKYVCLLGYFFILSFYLFLRFFLVNCCCYVNIQQVLNLHIQRKPGANGYHCFFTNKYGISIMHDILLLWATSNTTRLSWSLQFSRG